MVMRLLNRLCVALWPLVGMAFGLIGSTQLAVGQKLSELLGTWSGKGRIVLQANIERFAEPDYRDA